MQLLFPNEKTFTRRYVTIGVPRSPKCLTSFVYHEQSGKTPAKRNENCRPSRWKSFAVAVTRARGWWGVGPAVKVERSNPHPCPSGPRSNSLALCDLERVMFIMSIMRILSGEAERSALV